uniref:NADH dehydrogenase [ubiquinone] 1 alpha subcomplex subunit 13 n=1 Tax=Tetraselmis sp. GSL018 TaxID=582737 RepID=A0A061QUA6_9CHLO|mmetsp:Transcript_26656/g.63174  ORF Transcript_26656/g.63174 Transcript_26656/m.63174 type:complete len:144 (+) Transcript_26656:95-526(+)
MTEWFNRGGPGMKSVKDMPVLQDGPPPGGFPSIRIARRIPNTGPSGAAIFGVGALVMSYGFYLVGQTNIQRRADKAEREHVRRALVPFLQAEEDRRYLKAKKQLLEKEASIMKDVDGWEVGRSVFNSDRWMPPSDFKSGSPYT